jgi:hypothetical protein
VQQMPVCGFFLPFSGDSSSILPEMATPLVAL